MTSFLPPVNNRAYEAGHGSLAGYDFSPMTGYELIANEVNSG